MASIDMCACFVWKLKHMKGVFPNVCLVLPVPCSQSFYPKLCYIYTTCSQLLRCIRATWSVVPVLIAMMLTPILARAIAAVSPSSRCLADLLPLDVHFKMVAKVETFPHH